MPMEPPKQAQPRHRDERCIIFALKQGEGGSVQTLAGEIPVSFRESEVGSGRWNRKGGNGESRLVAWNLATDSAGTMARVVHGYEVAKPNAHEQVSGQRVWATGTMSEMSR